MCSKSFVDLLYNRRTMETTRRTVLVSALASFVVSLGVVGASRLPEKASSANNASSTPAVRDIAAEESSVIGAIQSAEPAVTSVIISKNVPVMKVEQRQTPFGFSIPQYSQNGTELQKVGGGTAFFLSSDGLLLTNKHVVTDDKAQYTVLLNDGRTLEAKVVARDPVNDIALLKVDGKDFPFLNLSASDDIVLGQTAIAIGNALGEFRNTVSVGVISGLQRSITAGGIRGGLTERLSSIIQTDAAINEGNSGGPLLNLKGQVIGMNTAVAAGAQNIGFALPVADLRRALESYKQYGRIVRPYIGIRYTVITPELQRGLAYDYGALIEGGEEAQQPAIIPDSPAEKAGLKSGDLILEADGEKLTVDRPLSDIISRKLPGEKFQLKIVRDGKERTVDVVLEEWKE